MDVKRLRKQLYKLDKVALTALVEKYRLPLTAFAFTYVRVRVGVGVTIKSCIRTDY